jgi:DNA-binding beta-propeller fold protein YncE/predicted Ser/Thr protein kinase
LRADPRIGTELAGYRLERLLGRGGMSVVYLAEDSRLGRKVALKLLAPELAEDDRFRERFLRESRLAALLDHPNVIPVYEAGEAAGLLYIAMRYVEGTDLRRLLDAEGPLAEARALSILDPAADALDAAHDHGLVHRDVKPGNVLLDSREHVYLADFGLTKQATSESGITETGQFVGTVDYVAPEQIQRERVGPQTDVYALGCVLYECLVGEPPYRSDSMPGTLFAHISADPPRPSDARPELPAAIDGVVARALAKGPADRYATCSEVVAAARAALGLSGKTGTAEAPATARRRRRLVAAAALLLAVIAAAVVAVLLTLGGEETAEPPVQLGPTSLFRVDPATNEVVAAVEAGIPLLSFPALTAGDGVVWLADQVGHTVSRFDAATATLTRTVAVTGSPRDIAIGAGAVWVVGADQGEGTLVKIDPATGVIRATYGLAYSDPVGVTADETSVWIAANDLDGNAVVRLAASDATQMIAIPFATALYDLATGPDGVWATSAQVGGAGAALTVTRLDAETGRAAATIELGRQGRTGGGSLALAGDSGWVIGDAGVVRFDTRTDSVSATIPFSGNDLYAIAADPAGVWVGAGDQPGRLVRIDPSTNAVVAELAELGKSTVLAVVVDDDTVWAY